MNQSEHPHREFYPAILETARTSIEFGFNHGKVFDPDMDRFHPELQKQAATFVTLEIKGALRGCIGSLIAHRPLITDIANNAHQAAFGDRRFQPLDKDEFSELGLHVSILSDLEPMTFQSEEDLISQIEPQLDGLLLKDAGQKGTFLPSVWEKIPDKKDFFRHLKRKAGFHEDHWSPTVECFRYRVELVENPS